MSTLPDIFIFIGNRIRVVLNPTLKKELIKFVDSSNSSIKEICESIDIDYTTLWDYLNRREAIPLDFFFKIKKIYGYDLSQYFEYLESGSLRKRVKIINNLSADLAKILGAHVADGHMRVRTTKFKENDKAKHYELILREEYESNINSFCNWFNNVFDFGLNYKKEKNHFSTYVSNKIILLYFNKIFNIPLGRKTEIIKIPQKIKSSNINIKKSFLVGLFMFDGSVDYTTGYISLVSKSRKLIEETAEMLDEINLEPDYVNLKPDVFGRYKLIMRKKEKLKGGLILFEKNTEKWYRLYEHIYGFKQFTNNLNGLISDFDKYYPNKRNTALSFGDILKIIPGNKSFDISFMKERLNRRKTSVYAYLRKLENWKILSTIRIRNRKIYKLNEKLPNIWRK